MAEIRVPEEERPSLRKYVVMTVIGLGLVNVAAGTFTQDASDPIFLLVVLIVAVVLDVGIVFLMVQSLIEEWFQAVTIAEE